MAENLEHAEPTNPPVTFVDPWVVVAQERDRYYVVPPEMKGPATPVEGDGWSGHVTPVLRVNARDGAPRFVSCEVTLTEGTMAPIDMQRLPWARIAEETLAYHAAMDLSGIDHGLDVPWWDDDDNEINYYTGLEDGQTAPTGSEPALIAQGHEAAHAYWVERIQEQSKRVRTLRQEDRKRAGRGGGTGRPYRPRDKALLRQVAKLRAETPAGVPMHVYIAEQLNYTPTYARRLSAEAAREFPRLARRRS